MKIVTSICQKTKHEGIKSTLSQNLVHIKFVAINEIEFYGKSVILVETLSTKKEFNDSDRDNKINDFRLFQAVFYKIRKYLKNLKLYHNVGLKCRHCNIS